MRVAGYPVWIEEWWIDRLRQRMHLELSDRHPSLEHAIQKLTDLFTTDRVPEFPDYFAEEAMQLAYGLFFFPRNFVRIQFPIAELLQRCWNAPTEMKILDLGSGTGASSLGTVHQLFDVNPHFSIQLHASDRSIEALKIFETIAANAPYENLNIKTVPFDFINQNLTERYDLIVLSFALNEASTMPEWFNRIDDFLEHNGILVILEPATREASERLERFRDQIALSNRLHIWGPCLHRQPCPLLSEGKFWCHEVRSWNPPRSFEILNRHLYREISNLKFSFLLLGRQPPPTLNAGPELFRLIAPWIKAKGKWITSGCASDGNRYQYELLRRNPDSGHYLSSVRGDIVDTERTKNSGSGIIRIESRV